MGFLDKAKAAANDLAAKADTALNSSGMGGSGANPQNLFRDLGMLVYDEHAGRPVDPDAKGRLLAELSALEQQGRLLPPTGQGGPPPPPGANAAHGAPPVPPPGSGGQAMPPPPAPAAPPTPSAPAAEPAASEPEPPSAPPPPAQHAPPPPPPPNWQSS